MHLTLETVFTAVELGRLLDAAKLPRVKRTGKVAAIHGETLFRAAAMRVAKACQHQPQRKEREVRLDTLCQQNEEWLIQDAQEPERWWAWNTQKQTCYAAEEVSVLA